MSSFYNENDKFKFTQRIITEIKAPMTSALSYPKESRLLAGCLEERIATIEMMNESKSDSIWPASQSSLFIFQSLVFY